MGETITVTPYTIYRQLYLRSDRSLAELHEPMWRWFLRCAKRTNCGIAQDLLRIEPDPDRSRRDRWRAVASIDVFEIPAGSGFQPGEIVNIQEEAAVLPDLQGPWMDELDKARGYSHA